MQSWHASGGARCRLWPRTADAVEHGADCLVLLGHQGRVDPRAGDLAAFDRHHLAVDDAIGVETEPLYQGFIGAIGVGFGLALNPDPLLGELREK